MRWEETTEHGRSRGEPRAELSRENLEVPRLRTVVVPGGCGRSAAWRGEGHCSVALTATPATRHHEQHLSQDCGDRSRGNGSNWRFALRPSVLFSAVSLLLELPSAASGLGRRSPTSLSPEPRPPIPLSPEPRPPEGSLPGVRVLRLPSDRARVPQPCTLAGASFQCPAPLRTLFLCFFPSILFL